MAQNGPLLVCETTPYHTKRNTPNATQLQEAKQQGGLQESSWRAQTWVLVERGAGSNIRQACRQAGTLTRALRISRLLQRSGLWAQPVLLQLVVPHRPPPCPHPPSLTTALT